MCRCALTVLALCAIAVGESSSSTNVVTYLTSNVQVQYKDNPKVRNNEDWIWSVGHQNKIPQTTETSPVVEKPVNELYPSAVLFGRTCGGTIISDRWILSAGHCTLFTGGREVLAGTNNSEDGSGVRRRVKQLHIHPLFSVGPYWLDAKRFKIKQVAARWDFLLAELEEPLPLDNKTMVAANIDSSIDIADGVHVGYAGFGAKNHGETMRHEMHGMELTTLSETRCSGLYEYNKEDMICARGRAPRYDSGCNGDSGSGLVTSDNTLVGVTSWVENDAFECKNGNIVVFSRVSAARDWIKNVTNL